MSDAKMVNSLDSMEIDEVSFVDRGAHQLADVVLSKRHTEDEDEEIDKSSPASGDLHVDKPLDEEDDKEKKDEEEESFLTKVFSKFGGMKKPPGLQPPQPPMGAPQMGMPQMPQPPQMQPPMGGAPGMPPQMGQPQMAAPQVPGQMPGMQAPGLPGQPGSQAPGGLAPLPQEAVDYIRQLEEQVQRLSQQGSSSPEGDGSPFGKSEEFEVTPDSTAILTELAKSLEDEEQRELVSKALDLVAEAEERAATAEEIAKAERDHRLNREFVELAKSYTNLPVSPEEMGPVLKRLYESMDEDDIAIIEKCLKSSDERLNGLFEEVGKRGGYETSIVAKVEAEALEMVSKSDGLTKEEAIDRVLASNPSTYDEYVRESAQMAREV